MNTIACANLVSAFTDFINACGFLTVAGRETKRRRRLCGCCAEATQPLYRFYSCMRLPNSRWSGDQATAAVVRLLAPWGEH